jgi:hypothetical protein
LCIYALPTSLRFALTVALTQCMPICNSILTNEQLQRDETLTPSLLFSVCAYILANPCPGGDRRRVIFSAASRYRRGFNRRLHLSGRAAGVLLYWSIMFRIHGSFGSNIMHAACSSTRTFTSFGARASKLSSASCNLQMQP